MNANKDGLSGTASRSPLWNSDALGNFEEVTTGGTTESRTHNKQNQLAAADSATLTYDCGSNMTTDETGRTFTWDAWNCPVKANGSARYAYDTLGRRIKDGSTDLYYDTDCQLVEERNSSNAPVAHYVWSSV